MQDFLEQAKAIVASQQQAIANRGTNLHGWAAPEVTVEKVEAVADRLAAQYERAALFRASPRGRFLQVIAALEETRAYDIECDRMRGFYSRSITPLNGPTLTREGVIAVAECLSILNQIKGRDARAGVEALVDLLKEQA